MEQKDREYAMEQFKTDPNTKMLVGTDLLSRGLDLPEVEETNDEQNFRVRHEMRFFVDGNIVPHRNKFLLF